jgi:DNA polymerase
MVLTARFPVDLDQRPARPRTVRRAKLARPNRLTKTRRACAVPAEMLAQIVKPEWAARRPTTVPKTAPIPTTRDFLPARRRSLRAARSAAAGCRGCGLWKNATQTVFGAGLQRSRLMLVGEMPGDREDVEGMPFVGPAGRVLDKALDEAAIDRREVYVTNVVKHFKWEPRGKRRLHRTPTSYEVRACLPWLELEIDLVEPRVLACLGATAAHALLGPAFSVLRERGRLVSSPLAPRVIATVHPSSLLRLPAGEDREAAMRQFVADLRSIRRALDDG